MSDPEPSEELEAQSPQHTLLAKREALKTDHYPPCVRQRSKHMEKNPPGEVGWGGYVLDS